MREVCALTYGAMLDYVELPTPGERQRFLDQQLVELDVQPGTGPYAQAKQAALMNRYGVSPGEGGG